MIDLVFIGMIRHPMGKLQSRQFQVDQRFRFAVLQVNTREFLVEQQGLEMQAGAVFGCKPVAGKLISRGEGEAIEQEVPGGLFLRVDRIVPGDGVYFPSPGCTITIFLCVVLQRRMGEEVVQGRPEGAGIDLIFSCGRFGDQRLVGIQRLLLQVCAVGQRLAEMFV